MIIAASKQAIEHETKKAILINGMGWLPKSQITWLVKNDEMLLHMPKWLFHSKNVSCWAEGHRVAWDGSVDDALNNGWSIA